MAEKEQRAKTEYKGCKGHKGWKMREGRVQMQDTKYTKVGCKGYKGRALTRIFDLLVSNQYKGVE